MRLSTSRQSWASRRHAASLGLALLIGIAGASCGDEGGTTSPSSPSSPTQSTPTADIDGASFSEAATLGPGVVRTTSIDDIEQAGSELDTGFSLARVDDNGTVLANGFYMSGTLSGNRVELTGGGGSSGFEFRFVGDVSEDALTMTGTVTYRIDGEGDYSGPAKYWKK